MTKSSLDLSFDLSWEFFTRIFPNFPTSEIDCTLYYRNPLGCSLAEDPKRFSILVETCMARNLMSLKHYDF